eukprot:gene4796-873_t
MDEDVREDTFSFFNCSVPEDVWELTLARFCPLRDALRVALAFDVRRLVSGQPPSYNLFNLVHSDPLPPLPAGHPLPTHTPYPPPLLPAPMPAGEVLEHASAPAAPVAANALLPSSRSGLVSGPWRSSGPAKQQLPHNVLWIHCFAQPGLWLHETSTMHFNTMHFEMLAAWDYSPQGSRSFAFQAWMAKEVAHGGPVHAHFCPEHWLSRFHRTRLSLLTLCTMGGPDPVIKSRLCDARRLARLWFVKGRDAGPRRPQMPLVGNNPINLHGLMQEILRKSDGDWADDILLAVLWGKVKLHQLQGPDEDGAADGMIFGGVYLCSKFGQPDPVPVHLGMMSERGSFQDVQGNTLDCASVALLATHPEAAVQLACEGAFQLIGTGQPGLGNIRGYLRDGPDVGSFGPDVLGLLLTRTADMRRLQQAGVIRFEGTAEGHLRAGQDGWFGMQVLRLFLDRMDDMLELHAEGIIKLEGCQAGSVKAGQGDFPFSLEVLQLIVGKTGNMKQLQQAGAIKFEAQHGDICAGQGGWYNADVLALLLDRTDEMLQLHHNGRIQLEGTCGGMMLSANGGPLSCNGLKHFLPRRLVP